MAVGTQPSLLNAIHNLLKDRVSRHRRRSAKAQANGGMHTHAQCSHDRTIYLIECFEQHKHDYEQLLAASERADGDKRPNRPERGVGYTDAEWALFIRGWDAHADDVYRSGLRTAIEFCKERS
ncbi:MAG: hypothetical protein ABL934_09780 [Lysobacteraceae bacterium]